MNNSKTNLILYPEDWEDYEDLESVIKGRPSEKWFKMMRRVR